MTSKLSKVIYPVVFAVAALLTAGAAAAQTAGGRNAIPDLVKMRRDFAAVAGADLRLVDDKVERGPEVWGAFRHWLMFVKPVNSGIYTVTYSFTFPDGDYSHGERSYEFRVLEQGCRRSAQPYIGAGNFCLGDTVILPVRLDGYVGHKFSVSKKPNTDPPQESRIEKWLAKPGVAQPPPESVRNPLAENLKYLGRVRHESVMRSGRMSVSYVAIFEAVKPGRFNFSLGPAAHPQGGPVREPDGQAVIVVDRDVPVTWLAQTERTLDFSRRYDSTVGNSNNYQISTMILQVGDTIAFGYWPGEGAASPTTPTGEGEWVMPPVIKRHEFKPRLDNYNVWINDYLPR